MPIDMDRDQWDDFMSGEAAFGVEKGFLSDLETNKEYNEIWGLFVNAIGLNDMNKQI